MLHSQTEKRYSRLTTIPKAQIFIEDRGSELRVSAKGKGEFLIPQEMCGGLHTHMTSP